MRPLGDITQDLEVLITEMIEQHDLQHGEVINLIHGYLEIHFPDAKEQYVDGDEVVLYYGPRSIFKKYKKGKR